MRAEPFDAAQLRAAFGEARAARPVYEQAMQDILASAAGEMSREGRTRLSEWPSPRTTTNAPGIATAQAAATAALALLPASPHLRAGAVVAYGTPRTASPVRPAVR